MRNWSPWPITPWYRWISPGTGPVEHPGDAARALWNAQRQAVVVTCGVDGCWYLHGSDPHTPRHQAAMRVTVVNTTGCGDVFHGAYAAGLAQGLDLPDRIRWPRRRPHSKPPRAAARWVFRPARRRSL